MSNGFNSNYNDSGYRLTSLNWYDQNNQLVSNILIPSNDIYATTCQVGVYMLDGTFGEIVEISPIFCSLRTLRNSGINTDKDDAWIVYPGFGFRLYDDVDYNEAGVKSLLYINDSDKPVIYSFVFNVYGFDGGFKGKGINVREVKVSNQSDLFTSNKTHSVRIYFRGREITISGLS
jgi:hypothetical protein